MESHYYRRGHNKLTPFQFLQVKESEVENNDDNDDIDDDHDDDLLLLLLSMKIMINVMTTARTLRGALPNRLPCNCFTKTTSLFQISQKQ